MAKGSPSPRARSRASRPPPQRGEGLKGRKAKLKVFRTPIGFHDAYVAAPSQRAALAAWGAESNLFGRGEAEVVDAGSGPGAKAALERPGEVIRVLRGSAAEQVKALGKAIPRRRSGRTEGDRPSPRSPSASRPLPAGERSSKPSRTSVDRAEAALAKAADKHRRERDKLLREEERLRERRRALEREQGEERRRLEEAAELARDEYRAKIAAWDEA